MQMNCVTLIGYLGAVPEVKFFESGTVVANLSVGYNPPKKSDGTQPEVIWFKVKAWGKIAEQCAEHLQKGDQVAIIGSLDIERWTKDGERHERIVILASSVQFGAKSTKTAPLSSESAPEGLQKPRPRPPALQNGKVVISDSSEF